MRTGVFVGLMYIADAIYKLGHTEYDLSPVAVFMGFVLIACVLQDLKEIFTSK